MVLKKHFHRTTCDRPTSCFSSGRMCLENQNDMTDDFFPDPLLDSQRADSHQPKRMMDRKPWRKTFISRAGGLDNGLAMASVQAPAV